MDLKALAETPIFIILCYCFSFVPWVILFALDFISPDWRTIRGTRISGMTHLFFSTISLGVAVLYLIVQSAVGDYKEVMASCVAATAALYHIFRSIWGLVQLRAYSVWCAKAFFCLVKLKSVDKVHWNPQRWRKDWMSERMPKFVNIILRPRTKSSNSSKPTPSNTSVDKTTASNTSPTPVRSSDSQEKGPENHASEQVGDAIAINVDVDVDIEWKEDEIAKYIDTRMFVNNQVIDNELFGSEMSVRLCLPSCGITQGLWNALNLQFDDWLCSRDIVRCCFRWTIAVLSNFGRHWVHTENVESFPRTDVNLYLPYRMKMPAYFHHVIRTHQNTLATDALFYNVEIYQPNTESDFELLKKHNESLRNLNIKQVLYFLALMENDGDPDKIRREAVEENRSTPSS